MVTIPIEVAKATVGARSCGTPKSGSENVRTGTATSAMPTPIMPSQPDKSLETFDNPNMFTACSWLD